MLNHNNRNRHFSSQTLLNKDRQCCESWRNTELGVPAVCAVGVTGWYDWHKPLSQSAVLFSISTPWHCRELSDEWYAQHIQLKFWVLQMTPAVTDRSQPVLRCQQSVLSVSSTTQLSQHVCCSLAASYIFLLTFSVLYYVTDSFFPIVPLSISIDTVLSYNYRITPAIKVIFWFQYCLLTISRFPHR